MGEHGLFGKNCMYETAYRIPLLIRWPARIAAGARVDRILDTVDFQSTLLSLMGMPTSGREQGRDASPLLRGEACDWDDVSYVHHSSHSLAGIFTPEWELILDQGGDHALFNRKDDPDQVVNRYADPACRRAVEELTGRIVRHHIAVDSPARAWLDTRQTGGAR